MKKPYGKPSLRVYGNIGTMTQTNKNMGKVRDFITGQNKTA